MTVTAVLEAVFPLAAATTVRTTDLALSAFATELTVKPAFEREYEALAVPPSFQVSLEGDVLGKSLPQVKYNIPPSFPTPKLY